MFSSTGLYKCATCSTVCAEPEALEALRKQLPKDCNGYSLADAYNVLKMLLARDDRAKQNGRGFLSGAEVAVIGGCMTRLRLADQNRSVEEYLKLNQGGAGDKPKLTSDDACEACGVTVANRECAHGILCDACDAAVHGVVGGKCEVR